MTEKSDYQYFYSSTNRIHFIKDESLPEPAAVDLNDAQVETLCGGTYQNVVLNYTMRMAPSEVSPPEQLCGNCRRVAEADGND